MKTVYQTDAQGIYLGPVEADESPLEPGAYLIPAGCVENAPPGVAEGRIAVWANGAWTEMNPPQTPVEDGEEQSPPLTDEELLALQRGQMVLSFAQLIAGLVNEAWITKPEGKAWIRGTLPTAVEALIASLPVEQQMLAEARAVAPSSVARMDPLVVALAAKQGKSDADLDQLFNTYAEV